MAKQPISKAEKGNKFDVSVLPDIKDFDGTLSQQVFQSLKSAILSLSLAPGTMISKPLVCEHFGISRSPVSEALTRLASEGLVDIFPQSASRVARFSIQEISECLFVREALELAALKQVVPMCGEELIADLAHNIEIQHQLIKKGDMLGFYEADTQFHSMILETFGNKILISATAQASMLLRRPREMLLRAKEKPENTLADHQVIFNAIQARDTARACDAMKMHLERILVILETLRLERADIFSDS